MVLFYFVRLATIWAAGWTISTWYSAAWWREWKCWQRWRLRELPKVCIIWSQACTLCGAKWIHFRFWPDSGRPKCSVKIVSAGQLQKPQSRRVEPASHKQEDLVEDAVVIPRQGDDVNVRDANSEVQDANSEVQPGGQVVGVDGDAHAANMPAGEAANGKAIADMGECAKETVSAAKSDPEPAKEDPEPAKSDPEPAKEEEEPSKAAASDGVMRHKQAKGEEKQKDDGAEQYDDDYDDDSVCILSHAQHAQKGGYY
jgi:hypothetical protein